MKELDMFYAVSFVLVVWFVLTVAVQFNFFYVGKIRRWDSLNLLPAWTFFAPNPDYYDYHLLYRDMLVNGAEGDFLEVKIHEAHWYKFIWNPSRRLAKALIDCVQMILRFKSMDIEDISRSLPYVLLANYVLHLPHMSGAEYTQFAIYRTSNRNFGNAEKIIVSALLPLNEH